MSCPTLPAYSNEIDHSAYDTTKLNNYLKNAKYTFANTHKPKRMAGLRVGNNLSPSPNTMEMHRNARHVLALQRDGGSRVFAKGKYGRRSRGV